MIRLDQHVRGSDDSRLQVELTLNRHVISNSSLLRDSIQYTTWLRDTCLIPYNQVTLGAFVHWRDMHIQLPYDIWFTISKYLSSDELKRLYSVNKALFYISMDEKYKAASIGSLSQSDTARSLVRLIEPDLVSRVQKLTLQPSRLCWLIYQTKSRQRLRNRVHDLKHTLLHLLRNRSPSERKTTRSLSLTSKQVLRNLNTIMAGLTALKSLKIALSSYEHIGFSPVDFRLLKDFNYFPFATNLQELDLTLAVTDIPYILSSSHTYISTTSGSVQMFPKLEILRLNLELENRQPREDLLVDSSLISILNGCGQSLHTLILNTGKGLEPSTGLLQHLSQNGTIFPSLSTLRLQQFYRHTVTDLSGLHSFLQTHKTSIRNFQLHLTADVAFDVPPSTSFCAHPMFTQMNLPLLHHLEMGLFQFRSEYLHSMVPFLTRPRHLRFLSIDCGQRAKALGTVLGGSSS
ncbi:hypothetical protein BJ165DRAFT_1039764 [Panaeolus papilionaceus]|nr:hypothetical protein BJ165DRAFT_1039764 [Panaeolus papilionaceus]